MMNPGFFIARMTLHGKAHCMEAMGRFCPPTGLAVLKLMKSRAIFFGFNSLGPRIENTGKQAVLLATRKFVFKGNLRLYIYPCTRTQATPPTA